MDINIIIEFFEQQYQELNRKFLAIFLELKSLQEKNTNNEETIKILRQENLILTEKVLKYKPKDE